MRKGFNGLSLLVQEVLRTDPFSGHLFVFRGKRAGMLKILFHDSTGMCRFMKRLEHGQFIWPSATSPGRIALSPPQLAALLDGCE